MGINSHGEGLGWTKKKPESSVEKMRALVSKKEEEKMIVHAENLEMQHDWLLLGEACIPPKIMWNAFLYDWSPEMLKFYANALQCTLPDPSNLKRWGILGEATCPLCSRGPVSAVHILAGCPIALHQGRYTWRHDKVLAIIREALSLSIARAKKLQTKVHFDLRFVRSGEKVQRSKPVPLPSIVVKSDDWTIFMDLGNHHYEFPVDVAVTSLCPDLMALSRKQKSVILVELTVPWDTNIPVQHLAKQNKYADLCSQIRQKGYKCHFYPVEVGARGLPAKSLYNFFRELGLGRHHINTFLQRVSKTALECSYRLWLRRSEQWLPGEGRVAAA